MEENKGLKAIKEELRKRILAKREDLSLGYIKASDRGIEENLFSLEEFTRAKKIFTYVSMAREINTRRIIDRLLSDPTKEVYVPLCTDKGVMEARRIYSLDDLKPGSFGILEPSLGSETISLEEIDFSIIPCLAASPWGARLGYGGGYYDRFFKAGSVKGAAILCRAPFVLEALAYDDMDYIFDLVVTEERIYRR